MKTLLSVNNYYYQRGGAEYIFLEHNRLFKNIGWDIIPFAMIHPNNLETKWDRFFANNIEFGEKYNYVEKVAAVQKVIYSIEARRKVDQLLKISKIDLCHCHNIYHHISPSILSKIKSRGIPLVMTLHDLKLACPNYQMLAHDGVCERCKGKRFYHALANKCIKGSFTLSAIIMIESYIHCYLKLYQKYIDKFIVPSQFLKLKLIEWGLNSDKIKCIRNFIDADNYSPDFTPGKKFLYFGRLSREKGLTTLIKAAKQTNCDIMIAGDGPEKANLVSLAARIGARVDFLGHLKSEKLKNTIKSCRATILPSEWYENAPICILESYALGKPVIGANIGGISELIEDDHTGYTFSSGSIDDLSKKIILLQGMKDNAISLMGRNGRALAEKKYNNTIYLSQICDLYRKLMN